MSTKTNLTGEHVSEAPRGLTCSSCEGPIKSGALIWVRRGSSQVRHAPACPRAVPFKNGLAELFPGDGE